MRSKQGGPASYKNVLEDGERLLWNGQLSFGLFTSTIATIAALLFYAWVFQITWFSASLAEFCNDPSVSRCAGFYVLVPPGIFCMSLGVAFDWLERRSVESGRAQAQILLTDRRLIRYCSWPWRRLRWENYLSKLPKRGLRKGAVRFEASYQTFALSPSDADHVLATMLDRRRSKA